MSGILIYTLYFLFFLFFSHLPLLRMYLASKSAKFLNLEPFFCNSVERLFSLHHLGSVHNAPFYKTKTKSSIVVKVSTLIRMKTPQKWRFLKMLSKVDITKMDVLKTHLISIDAQNAGFWKRSNIQQRVSQKWSNVNAQNRIFLAAFWSSGGSMWADKNRCFSFR